MAGKGKQQRQSLAQIAAELATKPAEAREPEPIIPGRYNDGTLYDLDGRPLAVAEDINFAELQAAALDGATVVWDPCGCGGYCNALTWFTSADLRREALKATPRGRKNDPAGATRLTGSAGDVILIAGGLRWGDLFS